MEQLNKKYALIFPSIHEKCYLLIYKESLEFLKIWKQVKGDIGPTMAIAKELFI